MKTTLAVIFSCVLVSSLALGSQSQSGERSSQWQILTKANFSSQIRLHPHLLLLITVPWSGEAQSLMKELANVVTEKQEKLGAIKLMLIYRNSEKVLADALGAMEEITILNYHHSVPYKYQGRLRPQNILSSAYSLMSFFPEELPLKPLKTHEELKLFLESTDKALLLLEFCGWTPRLLAKGKNNGTEDAFGEQGVPFGLDFKGETNITLEPRGNENQKGMQNEKLNCGIENGFNDIPWLGDFSRVNDSDPYLETENITPGVKLSCTIEEFKQFDFFLSKFMTVAGEFFLPLERQRFGLVSNRSLLSSLDIGDSGSWFAMVYFAGCPSCSKILKEGDDLRSVLQTQNSLVAEMEDDGHDTEPTLPSSEPSVVLFVDRSSDSSRIRRKSKAALNAFRELALDYQISFQMGGQSDNKPDKPSLQVYHASGSKFGHPKLSVSPTSQEMKVKDKISVMVINKGKRLDSITSDLQGSSLNEILGYLLQHKKKAKLSSLAKEVGFQLLSDDFDVKIADTSTSQAEPQSSQVSPELSVEGLVENSADLDKDQSLYTAGISAVNMAEESKPTVVEPSSEHGKERTTHVVTSTQSPSIEPAQFLASHELAITEDLKVEEKGFSQLDQLGKQQKYSQGFKGSFFFSDGGYRLLRALTSGSKIPSAVIIDPILQQHYVFPENTVFSYSSLATFLDGFCNGSLLPYQHSDSVVLSPREAPRPPFVNLDFHEVDFIPRVTTHTFSELVLGFNKSSSQYGGHAWKKDVLVLFTNNWCGFCLRMELVVREIYQAIKGYMNMLKSGSENGQSIFSSNNSKDATLKLPLIYLMDCTLNECSLILKSNDQREIYPALVLFPAETKNALSYEGDMAVTDVIKFIAGHGSNSHHLMGDNGILWTKAEKKIRNQNLFKEASPTIIHEEAPAAKEKQHEVLLKNRNPKRAYKYNRIRSYTSSRSHEAAYHVVVGSILVATDKLLDAHPFDKSTILIVKADQATGFHGLIINKHINWESLNELAEGVDHLKEAPLSFGGPVVKRGKPLVALTRRVFKDQYPEVLPGVYFLDQSATVSEIEGLKSGNESVTEYWFFVGFSNWGWDQLFDEIAEGAWNITDDDMGQLDWPLR